MFTGIIETLGTVKEITRNSDQTTDFTIEADFTKELIPGQSISHNGVCLTVTELSDKTYKVTAIPETLAKSNLGYLTVNESINLERCLKADGRFDGHIVQGHVDTMAVCEQTLQNGGELACFFRHSVEPTFITVQKGSVCINGVSLTVVESGSDYFSVALIPYTLKHTNLKTLKPGSYVNIEFDIIGKYLIKINRNIT